MNETLCAVGRDCDALAQRAALVETYIGFRGFYGTGDAGHTIALARAQEKVKKVRKALGFTKP